MSESYSASFNAKFPNASIDGKLQANVNANIYGAAGSIQAGIGGHATAIQSQLYNQGMASAAVYGQVLQNAPIHQQPMHALSAGLSSPYQELQTPQAAMMLPTLERHFA